MDATVAALLGAGIGGLAGFGSSWWGSRTQVRVARESREQDRLATAYLEAVTTLLAIMDDVEATLPVMQFGPDPRPPVRLDPKALNRVNALIFIFGTPELKTILGEWRSAINAFSAAVLEVTETEERSGSPAAQKRRAVEDARKDLRRLLERIEKCAQEDLRGKLS